MAIWLSLDFETTGLDKVKDRITEPGLVLWSTKINRVVESASFLVKTDVLAGDCRRREGRRRQLRIRLALVGHEVEAGVAQRGERLGERAPEFITAYRSAVGIREAEPEREALRISG